MIQRLSGGAPLVVPGSESALNITPMFSPDGQFLAYAQSGEQGTNIQVANVRDMCCVQRLTTGRFADNLSPTYAPDGQRIAFVSTRAGPPQIYVMEANGTDTELLVPFDFGVTGSSNAPEWSPDGVSLAFHREVSGGPQIFVLDVAGRRLKQLSSSGRNEDPTWAPDGRHIAFVSDRTGQRQIWVIDIETGRVRAITTGRGRTASRLVAAPPMKSPTPRRVIMTRSSLIAIGAFAFAAACGGKKPPETPAPEPAPAEAPAPAPAAPAPGARTGQ